MSLTAPASGSLSVRRVPLRLAEWERVGPATEGRGALLRGLSFGTDARARALASDLGRNGVATITELRDGLEIEAGSYIGRLSVGMLDLTIVPKVEWTRWLTLVAYGLKLRGLLRYDGLSFQVGWPPLQDLIILQLIAEARDLIARGLHREYIRRRAPLPAPRGRIDFGRIARQGGVRDAGIPCRFSRRSDNSPLNQALLAGLHLAERIAVGPSVRSDVRRLAHELQLTVTAAAISDELLRRAHDALDRRVQRYVPALELIELLWAAQSITLEDEPDRPRVALPGFVLDMNRLWQRLLARVLAEWSDGVEVQEEFALKRFLTRNQAFPYKGVVPNPRPDFAVFGNGKLIAYLDAKYRDLWSQSLPREMLYQVGMYAMAQGRGAAAMLYPSDSPQAVEQRLDIRDPITREVRAAVSLRPVRLASLEALISAPMSDERVQRRRLFATALIGL